MGTKIFIAVISIFLLSSFLISGDFKQTQLRYPRVKKAYHDKETAMKSLFKTKNMTYPPQELFIRVFKSEAVLELWARSDPNKNFSMIKKYNICTYSGGLGPKRRQGDFQVPEGCYHIDRFNPASKYHLSLGINYPNKSDRILGNRRNPGGNIFIHGNCVSIGCIPIQDKFIKELYVAAVESKNNGQTQIPVHIFPTRMDAEGIRAIKKSVKSEKIHKFWNNLKVIYDYFEEYKQPPQVSIDDQGRYHIDN